jgi:anti-sigma regulatory factor (Ser/Thr protein kinase)
LNLTCELAQVRPAAQAVTRFLAEQGCAEGDLMDCELALVEACNNAVQYAGPGPSREPILLEVLCDLAEIQLRVTDHTPGFEWPEKAVLPDPERESGRGLYLIRTLMTEARYFRSAGENLLVLRRKRQARSL